MKFTITMKDPDGFYDSITTAAVDEIEAIDGLNPDEREDLIEGRVEKLKEICKAFFWYDEYLTVEIDTVAKTCTVVKP
mgnify:FL=1